MGDINRGRCRGCSVGNDFLQLIRLDFRPEASDGPWRPSKQPLCSYEYFTCCPSCHLIIWTRQCICAQEAFTNVVIEHLTFTFECFYTRIHSRLLYPVTGFRQCWYRRTAPLEFNIHCRRLSLSFSPLSLGITLNRRKVERLDDKLFSADHEDKIITQSTTSPFLGKHRKSVQLDHSLRLFFLDSATAACRSRWPGVQRVSEGRKLHNAIRK